MTSSLWKLSSGQHLMKKKNRFIPENLLNLSRNSKVCDILMVTVPFYFHPQFSTMEDSLWTGMARKMGLLLLASSQRLQWLLVRCRPTACLILLSKMFWLLNSKQAWLRSQSFPPIHSPPQKAIQQYPLYGKCKFKQQLETTTHWWPKFGTLRTSDIGKDKEQ